MNKSCYEENVLSVLNQGLVYVNSREINGLFDTHVTACKVKINTSDFSSRLCDAGKCMLGRKKRNVFLHGWSCSSTRMTESNPSALRASILFTELTKYWPYIHEPNPQHEKRATKAKGFSIRSPTLSGGWGEREGGVTQLPLKPL